jgi:LytS/YehU family sensor histidine kinase
MILQPLAENAVKHGLSPSEGRVVVTLGCTRRADELELWVTNRPAPPTSAASAGFGIGLHNVRERLKALFGERARLEAGPDAEGWTSRIVLPWMSV